MPRSPFILTSVEIPKKRAVFTTAKKSLRELNLKYAMLYPDILKDRVDNKSNFFTSAQDV